MQCLSLRIADIFFHIIADGSDHIQIDEPAYRSFLAESLDSSEIKSSNIQVQFHFGQIPSNKLTKQLFSSGESWSLFQDGDGYCMIIQPPSFQQPILLAKMNNNFKNITVYLKKDILKREKNLALFSNPVGYPLIQILLIYILSIRQGALVHCAGIGIRDKGYIFPGKSGAGKSTIARLFAERKGIVLFSDDRIAVRKHNRFFKVYGTPWPGDAGIAENREAQLSGIFFISHGSENKINKISPKQALDRILPVTSIPWYDRQIFPKVLDLCEDLITHVPAFEFIVRPVPEAIDVFEEFVSSQ